MYQEMVTIFIFALRVSVYHVNKRFCCVIAIIGRPFVVSFSATLKGEGVLLSVWSGSRGRGFETGLEHGDRKMSLKNKKYSPQFSLKSDYLKKYIVLKQLNYIIID